MANRMVTLWTTQCELEWRKSWLVYVWALGLILENSCRYRHSYNGAAARKWRVIQGIFPDLEHEGCQPLLGVPFFFSPSPPPEVGPLKSSYGIGRSSVSSPSGVWGRAPPKITCGAFCALKSDLWWQQFWRFSWESNNWISWRIS